MEAMVARGTELADEQRRNPGLTEDPTTGAVTRVTRIHTDWDHYLLHGFRLAPTAPHDNHFANWGTGHSSRTVVFSEALTEEALYEAIDQRAVYASEDENLVLRFYADGRVPMGGRLGTLAAEAEGLVLLEDPDYAGPFEVRLYRGVIGGEQVELVSEAELGAGWHRLPLPLPQEGEHFFYVEVRERDAERLAVTAPIWIERLGGAGATN
jgi:hypothetical protein